MSDLKSNPENLFKHNLFYLAPENISGNDAHILGDDIHYLRDVLRKKEREELQFTDGQGGLYAALVVRDSRNRIDLQILGRRQFKKGCRSTVLAFVPLKGHRNEFIFEKATELGVDGFLIFFSQNSVVDKVSGNRLSRYRSIVKQSMLQSRRLFLPAINVYKDINAVCEQIGGFDRVYIADISGKDRIGAKGKKTLVVVGPEGGFEEYELVKFMEYGAGTFSLGEHRLRSETAAVAAAVITLIASH